jgi:hypothetical protein
MTLEAINLVMCIHIYQYAHILWIKLTIRALSTGFNVNPYFTIVIFLGAKKSEFPTYYTMHPHTSGGPYQPPINERPPNCISPPCPSAPPSPDITILAARWVVLDGDDGALDDYSAFDGIIYDDSSAVWSQSCADAPARDISGQSSNCPGSDPGTVINYSRTEVEGAVAESGAGD